MLAHASAEMCDGPRFIDVPGSSAGKTTVVNPVQNPDIAFTFKIISPVILSRSILEVRSLVRSPSRAVGYFAFIPSGLSQRGEVTQSVHHSDDLAGTNRAVIGVGPYLIEDHIGPFDQHPSRSEYFRVTLAQTRVLDQQFRPTAKIGEAPLRGCSFPISM